MLVLTMSTISKICRVCRAAKKRAGLRTLEMAKLIIVLFVPLVLQACKDATMGDLRNFVDTAYQDKKPEIEPLPEIRPYKGFEYSASQDQDPFNVENIVNSRSAALESGLSPDANRRKEALEQYPLDALKLVGTMSQGDKPWVIVQTSEGTAHRATIGNYMGQNDGKIKQIIVDEQRLVLAELVIDPKGVWVTREVEIIIDE